MNKDLIINVIGSLKKLRSDIISIMSGLGLGTTKYYRYLCSVVDRIEISIIYYSKLLEDN